MEHTYLTNSKISIFAPSPNNPRALKHFNDLISSIYYFVFEIYIQPNTFFCIQFLFAYHSKFINFFAYYYSQTFFFFFCRKINALLLLMCVNMKHDHLGKLKYQSLYPYDRWCSRSSINVVLLACWFRVFLIDLFFCLVMSVLRLQLSCVFVDPFYI